MEGDRTANLIVRAATTQIIDFSKCDPQDNKWWRKVKIILAELERQLRQEAAAIQHRHWVTLASHGRLEEESFRTVCDNATSSLQRYFSTIYPWVAKELQQAGTSVERMIEEYHEEFGRPGEARYEAMVDETLRALRRMKGSPLENERERRRRALAARKVAETELQTAGQG